MHTICRGQTQIRWTLRGASVLLVLSALHTAAWSIVRRHDRTDAQYITFGSQPQFQAAGYLISSSSFGSGTVIADGSWVLTAAHVVGSGAPSNWSFVLGSSTYSVAAIYVHPLWNGNISNGRDIALVKLSSAVTGVTPAQIYTGSPSALIGAVGYSVGYGLTGTGSTGYGGGIDGNRRAMENVIDAFYNSNSNPQEWFLSDFDSPSGNTNSLGVVGSSPNPLNLEGVVAPGDSGGPVFVLQGSNYFIAGVHSFLADVGPPIGNNSPDARYGDLLGSTRVDLYADWINSTIPEPASMTALAVGLVGVLVRRRRR